MSTPTSTINILPPIYSKRGRIVQIVRERYLRQDISCQSSGCTRCPNNNNTLSSTASHLLIPTPSTLSTYFELFLESTKFSNIILLDTSLVPFSQSLTKSREYKRLRTRLISDPSRHCIVFNNEHYQLTFIKRLPNEPVRYRDLRACLRSAEFYWNHLDESYPLIILCVDEEEKSLLNELVKNSSMNSNGIAFFTINEYIRNYLDKDPALLELATSIQESIAVAASTPSTKKLFQPHHSVEAMEAGIKSGLYFKGKLTIHPSNRSIAFVDIGHEIVKIVGHVHRNRAIHGDIVCVSLEKTPVDASKAGTAIDDTPAVEAEPITHNLDKPLARVLGILTPSPRTYICTLLPEDKTLATPLNVIIPKIRIKHSQPQTLQTTRFVVRIDTWPIDSNYPSGHFVKRIGDVGELDTEINAILLEHDINPHRQFSDIIYQSLPKLPWTPTQSDLANRRDLRNLTIFSIDPPNCQDIDDCLHFRELPSSTKDKKYEIGVHIADVSHFVPLDSFLDIEARDRGTTVYLADRRFDMLPSVLSERVCSLRELHDRLTVSVIWTLNSDLEIVDTWFGRTVIHSAWEGEYSLAQRMLDGERGVLPKESELAKVVNGLAKFARKHRERRMAKGGLELASVEVKFKIDNDGRKIQDVIPKEPMEIHKIVEECMVMANASVAEFIYNRLPTLAFLRKHPHPAATAFETLNRVCAAKGITMDTSSSRALAVSLQSLPPNTATTRLVKMLATSAMSEAQYCSTGETSNNDNNTGTSLFTHYGLAIDYYTHFTSPIRRYADIIVHRQLLSLLSDNTDTASASHTHLGEIAAHLNSRNREAKLAGRDSVELFQSMYISQQLQSGHHVIADGVISEIRANGFFVFVPRFGIRGPVYLRTQNEETMCVPKSMLTGKLEDANDMLEDCSLEIGADETALSVGIGKQQRIAFSLFDSVQVMLNVKESPAHRPMVYMTLLGKPTVMRIVQQKVNTRSVNSNGAISTTTATQQSIATEFSQHKNSLYDVLDAFEKLSIDVNTLM